MSSTEKVAPRILPTFVLFFISVLVIFLLSSCEKEQEERFVPVPLQSNETSLLEEARQHFENEVDTPEKENGSTSKKHKGKKRQNLKKYANWEQAYTKDISTGTAIIVPLLFEEDLYAKLGVGNKVS